jgi:hypothetical protein
MTGHSNREFDFEKWAKLASSDPQSFEQLRQDKIADVIGKATGNHQQRLRKLQWRIDQVRNKNNKTSSMAACLAISDLMWDTFERLNELLQLQAKNSTTSSLPLPEAKIISFPATTKD